MTLELPPDAQTRLDAHLDAVERALIAAGRSREQRRGIIDDLETQIMDMLAKQSPTPALTDVEAILGRLDPPDAYADASAVRDTVPPVPVPTNQGGPRFSRTAIAGFICLLTSLLPWVLPAIYWVFWSTYARTSMGHSLPPQAVGESLIPAPAYWVAGILMAPLAVAGTVLGWVALGKIRASKRALRGSGLALFDGVFYPVIFMIIFALRLAHSL